MNASQNSDKEVFKVRKLKETLPNEVQGYRAKEEKKQ